MFIVMVYADPDETRWSDYKVDLYSPLLKHREKEVRGLLIRLMFEQVAGSSYFLRETSHLCCSFAAKKIMKLRLS